jgi:hypothetical protein
MGKVKADMRIKLAEARGPIAFEDTMVGQPAGEAPIVDDAVDVYSDFRTRFGLFVRIRNVLIRQRIRAHVISGIEFMMFVFIVGPLIDWIVGTTVIASALLAGFELLLIYKLWTATKTYDHKMAALVKIPAQVSPSRDEVPAV